MQPSESDVTVLLLHRVQRQRKGLAANTLQSFPAAEAARLIALGAATMPPAPVGLPPVAGKIVNSFSPDGAKFARLGDKKAAEFVIGLSDAATLAECQAIEYRREGGVRPAVMEALADAFGALQKAAES